MSSRLLCPIGWFNRTPDVFYIRFMTRSWNVSKRTGSWTTKTKVTPDASESQPGLGGIIYETDARSELRHTMPSRSHVARLRKHRSHQTVRFGGNELAVNAEHHACMLLEAVLVGFDHGWSSQLQHTKVDPSPNKFFEQVYGQPYYMKVSGLGPRFHDNVEQVCWCRGLLPSWV